MRSLLAHPLARAFTLLAAVLWLWSTSANRVHLLVVQHVVCGEHGKLSEVHDHSDPNTSHEEADGPSIVADHGGHPEHGCTNLSLTPDRPPPVLQTPRITRLARLVSKPLATQAVPRTPPLDYAPKTSPPLAIG